MDESRDLVRDASRGEPRAVESLLELHLPGLRRYVQFRAGRAILERESGSDVVQSVCRELLERLRVGGFEYRGEHEFKNWLYGATLFKIQNRGRRWRAEKRGHVRETALGDEHESSASVPVPASPATPSHEAIRREDVERLDGALAELPAHYQEIVQLAYFEGLSHKEIAARLSISETYSRVLLVRALARLAALGVRRPD